MEPINQAPAVNPPAPKTVAGAIGKTIFWGALAASVTHLCVKIFKLSPIITVVNTVQTVANTAFTEAADIVGQKYAIEKHKIAIIKSVTSAVITAIGVAVLFGANIISPPIAIISTVGGAFMLGVEIYAALHPKPEQSVVPNPA